MIWGILKIIPTPAPISAMAHIVSNGFSLLFANAITPLCSDCTSVKIVNLQIKIRLDRLIGKGFFLKGPVKGIDL